MAERFDPMLPGWPGGRDAAEPSASELSELAEAVREHERITTRGTVPKRPADHQLYRRLTEIEAMPAGRRNGG
jgi:hypothetical protein